MNRVERRVRDLINQYSTAFASWWCVPETITVPWWEGRTLRYEYA